VAVAVYALKDTPIELDRLGNGDPAVYGSNAGITATTIKGSIAARFKLAGRPIVIASTHGTEGVRGKTKDETCSGPVTDAEKCRVKTFRKGGKLIKGLRNVSGVPGDVAAVWAGDFNGRSVWNDTGCPIWPTHNDSEADLALLRQGRDVLGWKGEGGYKTFADELKSMADTFNGGFDLTEVEPLRCPTYKKSEKATTSSGLQFQCKEDDQLFYYKPSHPPSWTDRIFTSTTQQWFKCSKMHRVVHTTDHDSIFVTCTIEPQRQ